MTSVRTKATKLSYTDKDHSPSGVERLVLGTGSATGVTKALVLGKGSDLGIPTAVFGQIPFDGQVTIQLRSSSSATCLQADYAIPALFDGKGLYKDRTY